MYVCAFTGHRPKRFAFGSDEQHALCKAIKHNITRLCRRLYENQNVRMFYSGCAQGVDMWGAEAVIALRSSDCPDIQLCCAVPFSGHDAKWSQDEQERLANVLLNADKVITVSLRYEKDVYERRNRFMVDNAQFLIAVYDHLHPSRSGTMQTVNYAKRNGVKIAFIHPDTAEISSNT